MKKIKKIASMISAFIVFILGLTMMLDFTFFVLKYIYNFWVNLIA
jgi:hypothetical protein